LIIDNCESIAAARGFTLLELLLAVLLVGMISTMVYSVLNVGVGLTDRGEERILFLGRQQGLLNLLHAQIRAAAYDKTLRGPDILAEGDMLRLLTRQPLDHDFTGLVLAFYRYDHGDRTLYYTEKRDYYNIDYQNDFRPDFVDMRPLLRLAPSGGPDAMAFAYDDETFTVTLDYLEKEYIFSPKCTEALPLPE
jgi:prepilin-type N-terminal cleavage/methylation domain-containing protein